jgi:hypothetical protein
MVFLFSAALPGLFLLFVGPPFLHSQTLTRLADFLKQRGLSERQLLAPQAHKNMVKVLRADRVGSAPDESVNSQIQGASVGQGASV